MGSVGVCLTFIVAASEGRVAGLVGCRISLLIVAGSDGMLNIRS